MSEKYDAVVIGLGPGGEVTAGRLLAAGWLSSSVS
jgi:pyruvate/2-oxoglutarate dehydrogenase complex dihydrolipoamide dehydrogenase (E3) component